MFLGPAVRQLRAAPGTPHPETVVTPVAASVGPAGAGPPRGAPRATLQWIVRDDSWPNRDEVAVPPDRRAWREPCKMSGVGHPVATTWPVGALPSRVATPPVEDSRCPPRRRRAAPCALSLHGRQAPVKAARLVRAVAERLTAGGATTAESVGPSARWGLDLAPRLIIQGNASVDSDRAIRLDRNSCDGQGLASRVRWCRVAARTPHPGMVPSTRPRRKLDRAAGTEGSGEWSIGADGGTRSVPCQGAQHTPLPRF